MSSHIVVGVDGSDESRVALDRAIEEARLRDGVLHPVIAWTPPTGMGPQGYARAEEPRDAYEQQARATLEEMVATIADDVEVHPQVKVGPASQVLIDLSEDADLVVVGTRGRGGFVGLVLGSTSHQVTSHAKCPVLVVPPRARS